VDLNCRGGNGRGLVARRIRVELDIGTGDRHM
jgi:hypothetical protein